MGVKIDELRCVGCGACTFVCPVSVLLVEDMKCRVHEGCISCGLCVDRCHWRAITLIDEPARKKKPGASKRGAAPLLQKSPSLIKGEGHRGRDKKFLDETTKKEN